MAFLHFVIVDWDEKLSQALQRKGWQGSQQEAKAAQVQGGATPRAKSYPQNQNNYPLSQ